MMTSFGIAAAEPVSAVVHRIVIENFEFVPAELEVLPGDTLIWENEDIVPHNIVIGLEHALNSPDMQKSDLFTIIAKNTFSYGCGLHPSMTGKITIASPNAGWISPYSQLAKPRKPRRKSLHHSINGLQ